MLNHQLNVKKIASVVIPITIWLTFWQILSNLINSPISISSPVELFQTIFELFCWGNLANTLEAIYTTISHILLGVGLAYLIGIILAIISYLLRAFHLLIQPIINLIKTVPVVALIVVTLVFFDSRHLSILVCVCIVTPIVYLSILGQLRIIDKSVFELTIIDNLTKSQCLFYVFFPQICEGILSSVNIGVSFGFKSAIAAELVGVAQKSIGEQIYLAKTYFEINELLAWIFILVILSLICEKIIVQLLKLLLKRWS